MLELKQGYASSGRGLPQLRESIEIRPAGVMAIIGANGSGKSRLGRMLAGTLVPRAWERRAEPGLTVELVSFDAALDLVRSERRRDESDLHGGAPDLGRTLRTLLDGEGGKYDGLLRLFKLEDLLDRGLRAFSSGELRKSLLVRALVRKPDILIIDDPYDGLDVESRQALQGLLDQYRLRRSLVLISGRERDIPADAYRVIRLEAPRKSPVAGNVPNPVAATESRREHRPQRRDDYPLIELRNVSLRYAGRPILQDINWRVEAGEEWQLTGPNGSGKTSLLEMISGDNTKGYGQELILFGRRKGSGESVWEIKRRLGLVSAAMQGRLSPRTRLEEIILSGYFDSLDLYDTPTPLQRTTARLLAERLGIGDFLDQSVGELSFGIQRVALIARALVKRPELMLLDEPCQGLDDANAEMVLEAAARVAEMDDTALIFVSHDTGYHVRGIRRRLRLTPHPEGGYTSIIESMGDGTDAEEAL